jgi:hypothetical protein
VEFRGVNWIRTEDSEIEKRNAGINTNIKGINSSFAFERLHTKQHASSVFINVMHCPTLPQTAQQQQQQQQQRTLKQDPLTLMKQENVSHFPPLYL